MTIEIILWFCHRFKSIEKRFSKCRCKQDGAITTCGKSHYGSGWLETWIVDIVGIPRKTQQNQTKPEGLLCHLILPTLSLIGTVIIQSLSIIVVCAYCFCTKTREMESLLYHRNCCVSTYTWSAQFFFSIIFSYLKMQLLTVAFLALSASHAALVLWW